MGKKQLRNKIRSIKRQYSSSQLEEMSLNVLNHLDANEHLCKAKVILAYYSLNDEVCTHQYIDHLVELGKQVLLPVVVDGEHMILREYTGKQDLKEGAYHIQEPTGKLFPQKEYSKIEVGIIPGMGFDKQGNRLGRGKGYYDRFLAQVPQMYKIGICFPFQQVEQVPTNITDVPMDEIYL